MRKQVTRARAPFETRFWRRVDKTPGCWFWTGLLNRDGYGCLQIVDVDGMPKTRVAHRIAWEMARGPIPAGLELHHACGERSCVRPAHLQPMSHAQNLLLRRWKTHAQLRETIGGNNRLAVTLLPEHSTWVRQESERRGVSTDRVVELLMDSAIGAKFSQERRQKR